MTELEKMQRAQMYIEKMANGINPLTDSSVPDEDLINNVRISRCLFYVSDVLKQVIGSGGTEKSSPKKNKKLPFGITAAQAANFGYSDVPITVSEITKRINDICDNEKMKKLPYRFITDYLISAGFLTLVQNENGRPIKRPTDAGIKIGIQVEERHSDNGPYYVVVYSKEAQKFIIDNIEAIISVNSENTELQGTPWSDEHTEILIDLFRKEVPLQEIAVTLKRTSESIRARLKKLGYQI